MTTFQKWVLFSADVLKNSLELCKEHQKSGNDELFKAQFKTLDKQIISFHDYVNRMEKFPK